MRKIAGWVYLVKYPGGNFKIGCTTNLGRRFRELQRQSPERLYLYHSIKSSDIYKLENKLHKLFGLEKRRRGEFFFLSEADVDSICMI